MSDAAFVVEVLDHHGRAQARHRFSSLLSALLAEV